MAEQEQSVEEWAGDLVFGEEPSDDAPPEEAEERDVTPVVEGDEADDEPNDDEVEASDDEESEDAEFGEVEIDGVVYENVPAQLIAEVQKAQDYTQKTQDLSAQRKEVETAYESVAQTQKQYEFAQKIQPVFLQAQQANAIADQWRDYLRQNVDQLTSTEIEKGRMAISDAERERDQLIQQIQYEQQEFEQAREQSVKELLDKSTQVLRQKVPDWDKASEGVASYVAELGFTPEQIAMAKTDPRQMQLAYKAMRYDQLQTSKPAAVSKAQSKIKAKSRNPMPKETQDKLNLRKKLKSNAPAKAKRQVIEDSIANSKFFR